jgi:hypothetical protein
MSADLKEILCRKKGLSAAAPEVPAQTALPPIVVTPMNATEATAAAKEIGAAALVKADEAMQQAKTQAVRAAGALRRRLGDAGHSPVPVPQTDAPSERAPHSTNPARRKIMAIALTSVTCIVIAVGGWFITHHHATAALSPAPVPTVKAPVRVAPVLPVAAQAPAPIPTSTATPSVTPPAIVAPVVPQTMPAALSVVALTPATAVVPAVVSAPTTKPVVKQAFHAAARTHTATTPAWQDKANADMDAYLKSH